jgi:hypothetical protein
VSPLRELAAKAAADAHGDLRKAWPAFYQAAMAAEAGGRVNFFEELPISPENFPVVFFASGEAMRRAPGDRDLAAALLREQLDRRGNPEIVSQIDWERRMKLWPLLMDLLREACEAFKKRSD